MSARLPHLTSWRPLLASLGAVVAYVTLTLAGTLLAELASMVASAASGTTADDWIASVPSQLGVLNLAGQALALAVGVPWLAHLRGRGRARGLPSAAVLACAFAAGVAWQLVATSAGTLVELASPGSVSSSSVQAMVADMLASPAGAASLLVVAPVVEEVFFRGIALEFARSAFGATWPAVALTAAVFSLAHGNLEQAAYALPLGVVLGAVTCRVRSIVPSVALHLGFNLFSTAFGFLWAATEAWMPALALIVALPMALGLTWQAWRSLGPVS